MTRINDKTLSLTPGKRVELYSLDLRIANGPILRFTPNREDATPAQCYRLSDTDATNARRITGQIPVVPEVGEVLLLEGLCRHGQAATSFPSVMLTPTDSPNNWDRPMFNLPGLESANNLATPITSAREHKLTQAGEWVYFTVRWTIGAPKPSSLFLHLYPALGATYPTVSVAATGSVDFAALRMFIIRDGLRIPVMIDMDLSNTEVWTHGASVSVVANTAEAVKVPVWQGNEYTPIPIKATGFEKTGNGAFPKPKLSMSNLTGAGSLLMQQYGDIRGATVTRTRMYADHLDNGPDPDPLAFYQPDVFTLVRRSMQDSQIIEFELASKLDQQGVQLPRRQLLRDVCPFVYRKWNAAANGGAGAFDYTDATCPYTGPAMFDIDGDPVASGQNDVCSHTLINGCRKRYGENGVLPFGGFPMVGRFRR